MNDSRLGPVHATDAPVTQTMRELAERAPDRPALTCDTRSISRAELESNANRLARALEAMGIGFGDVVSIALPNSIEFLETTLAAWKLGATPQLLSHRLPRHERQAIVDLAEPALIVGVDPADHPDRRCLPAGYVPDGAIDDAPLGIDRVAPSMSILASGGSTGRPKLMVFGSPAALDPAPLVDAFSVPSDGAMLIPNPLYHSAGFTFSWYGLLSGSHVVILPRFDAVAALDAIQRHRAEWVFLVPTMMSRMLRALEDEPGRFDLSSLRTVWHGAAACPPWVKEAWIDLVGADKVMELYGASESPVAVVINGTDWLAHRGSVGRPPEGTIKILGPDGEELPAGEVGEIFSYVTPGAPVKATLVGAELQMRGDWMTVGDLGWLDDEGYLYVSDRRVDMIVSGGANVYPAEVEVALTEHPSVATAVVVGLPDGDLGQRIHAVVEAADHVTEDELLAFLADRLVRYKIPRSIRIARDPLRDDAGKVRRALIREQEIARCSSPSSEPSGMPATTASTRSDTPASSTGNTRI